MSPYEKPNSPLNTNGKSPLVQTSHFASISISIFSVLIHFFLLRVALQFEEVFVGFGAKLPILTQAFMPGSILYYILPGMCLLTYAARWFIAASANNLFVAYGVVSGLMVPTFIVAMYLPIFQLGTLVGE